MSPRPRLSPEQFAQDFARRAKLYWTIAAAVAGRELAEDIVQEAAMIALSKLADFSVGTSLQAWFSQIVRFTAQNARRRARRFALLPGDLPEPPAPARTPDAGVSLHGELHADHGAFDDRLVAALATLREEARACLLLRAVHELPYAEIAELLGMPENTAMSHVHRARAQLQGELAPRADHRSHA